MTARRSKVVPLNSTSTSVEEARKFLADKTGIRGVLIVAFYENGNDAYVTFGDVSRKDVSFIGSVLTAEAIGLDTGE